MNLQESYEATIEGLKETVRSQRVEMEALKAQLLQAEAPRPRETVMVFEEQALRALFTAANLAGLRASGDNVSSLDTSNWILEDADWMLLQFKETLEEARDG